MYRATIFALIFAANIHGAIFPGIEWATHATGPGMGYFDQLSKLTQGRGCVVHDGEMIFAWGDQGKSSDVASAFKPVLSTLLLFAIQEGRIESVDSKVADFEPALGKLGKDGEITWRHLASQTSGYGLGEKPGEAYSYNDYALALYYDVLMNKVFRTNGTEVLRTRLAEPLGFQDRYTFNAFGEKDRAGRLALSVRDFSRFGWFILNQGKWKDKQLLRKDLLALSLNSVVPANMPLTKGTEGAMLPGQRTIGGTRNITPIGPGYYSFNWWLNRTNASGLRLIPTAPEDIILASGHGGKRVLLLVPSAQLAVCWNDAVISDHDASPANSATKMNQAGRLISQAINARQRF